MSFTSLSTVVLFWTVLLNVHRSCTARDISAINPPVGTCLCLSTNSVNIRLTPCGTVIGSADVGACFKYQGTKTECILADVTYQYFEVEYGTGNAWIAGIYLVLGSDQQCGAPVPPTEFRSMFMATVWNGDWPSSSTLTTAVQQQQLIEYLTMMSESHMNVLHFQARPAGDAFYSSTVVPWSRFLTNNQGTPPSPFWDPLQFAVDEAHLRGMEVHVWLNPYRANVAPNWNGLAVNHMANVYRQHAHPYSTYLWMDPGVQVVEDHVVAVIQDIVTRYDVDGVSFDHYFYPESDGTQFPDDDTYAAYVAAGGNLIKDDWRRDNVNRLVARVYSMIKTTKKHVKLTICPFGIYRPGNANGMAPPIAGMDPYSAMYADAKLWLQSGWLDALCPQLFWDIATPAQSYITLLDWWLANNPVDRHVYASNAIYKIDETLNNWPVSEIATQVGVSREQSRRAKHSLGNVHYSGSYFRDNIKGIRDMFQADLYTNKALTPPMPWLNVKAAAAPDHVTVQRTGCNDVMAARARLTWAKSADDVTTRFWSILRRDDDKGNDWSQYDILSTNQTSLELKPGSYSIRGVNKASEQGDEVLIKVPEQNCNTEWQQLTLG